MKPRRLASATTFSMSCSRGTVTGSAPPSASPTPPHEWGGLVLDQPLRRLRRHLPMNGEDHSRHLPMNGEDNFNSSPISPIPRLRRVLPHKWGRPTSSPFTLPNVIPGHGVQERQGFQAAVHVVFELRLEDALDR